MHHPRSFLALSVTVLAALLCLGPAPLPGARPLAGAAVAAPNLDVSPTTVGFVLMSGATESRTVTLANSGDLDLDFTTSLRSPPPPGTHLSGPKVAVHLTDVISSKGIYFCSPASAGGPAPDNVPCSDFVTHAPLLTGRYLYVVVADADTQGIGGVNFGIDYDGARSSGVDIVGSWYLCTSGLQFPSATWPAPGSGNVITWNVTIDCPNTRVPPGGVQGIAGGFYVYAYSDDVFRITEHTKLSHPSLRVANCLGIETTLDPATAAGSAAFSNGALYGANPCIGAGEGGGEPPWLTVAPTEGTVAPGANALLELTADAAGTPPGASYSAVLQVNSNDPLAPHQEVQVSLDVIGIPDIALSKSVLDFGTVFVGTSKDLSLTVSNPGTNVLTVTGIAVDDPAFSVFPAAGFSLDPGGEKLVTVTCRLDSPGSADGALTIDSNDPDEGTVTVALHADAIPPPVIDVSPDSLGYPLPQGTMETRTVTLSNDGGSNLEWAATLFAGSYGIGVRGPKVALHVQPHVVSKTFGVCDPASAGGPAPTDIPCSEFVTAAPLDSGRDIYIVVGNADSTGVGGVLFGIDYDGAPGSGADLFGGFRLCASGLQFPSATWPAAGSGNVITWNTATACATTEIPPNGVHGIAGAFYVYAYSADTFRITEHTKLIIPSLKMANCLGIEIPLDPATDAGAVAFSNTGAAGINPCSGEVGGGTPPPWLSVDPAQGTIAPGASALLQLTADATGLDPATSFAARMRVNSNDPATPVTYIPVTLDVLYPPVDAAAVDLEPGTLNAASGGSWVFATVELPPGYDPADLLLETVKALGTVPADPTFTEYVDFNGNGVTDRKMRFDRAAVIAALPEGDVVEIVVTGEIREQATLIARRNINVIRPHLMSPNGGETLQAGSWVAVTWQKPSGWDAMTTSVFYRSQAANGWTLIAEGISGSKYPWQVADEISDACRIRIETYAAWGLAGYDVSDAAFSIAQETTGAEDPPAVLGLLQNTPNPFRGATVIRFALPGEDRVSIRVFDASGRKVQSLVDAVMPAGPHEVTWNGRNDAGQSVASGIYFYMMETSVRREMKRMFLLR